MGSPQTLYGGFFIVVHVTFYHQNQTHGVSYATDIGVGCKTLPYKYYQITKVLVVCFMLGFERTHN